MLEIKNLSVAFKEGDKETSVVENVSLSLDAGKILALVGESGSGKTLTALSIVRLLPPGGFNKEGSILFDDEQDLLKISEGALQALRGKKIGFIFQEPTNALNPLHTIYAQVSEAFRIHESLTESEILKKVKELFHLVEFPEGIERFHAYPHELSGGQRQRVIIAMALACDPSLVIADEPTTALDVTTQIGIIRFFQKLKTHSKTSFILISHNLPLVAQVADEMCVMQKGKIVERGPCETIFKNPTHEYTKRLLKSMPEGSPLSLVESESLPLLHVNSLEVSYQKRKKKLFSSASTSSFSLAPLSFSLREKETLGIVGESGSGKSTLAFALLGLLPLNSGHIFLNQERLDTLSKKERRQRSSQIQLIFQDPFNSLSPRLSVFKIVEEGLRIHKPELSQNKRKELVLEVLEEVGLDALDLYRYPHEFSGGQRQRIAIARALVLNPKVLILDEPTSALDLSIQKDVIDFLRKLQKDKGLSYIFISHDLHVVRCMSHRILVLRHGKLVEEASAEDLFIFPKEDYTKKLIQSSFL